MSNLLETNKVLSGLLNQTNLYRVKVDKQAHHKGWRFA